MNFFMLSGAASNYFKLAGASKKIVAIMKDMPTINTRGGSQINENEVIGEVQLENVNFAYPTKLDVQVLKNFNLTVKKNTIVALCGESGCGKSSIIGLIQRWYEPQEGTVRFSGVDIKTLDPKWYKEHVAIV